MRNFLAGMISLVVLVLSAASVDAATGRTPLRLIEGRAAFEAGPHLRGNDFGPDFERILPIPGKAA